MKVYLSGDIEGITGLVAWSQCGRPNAEHFDYSFARRMYTNDINAAIRGAKAAGAKDICLKDSHGNSKNLLIDQLEPGVELVSGYGSRFQGMMAGIREDHYAAVLIGYHSMAGTLHGVMDHTISGRVHRMWVNGDPMGEIGLSAMTAGSIGVPIVAISSDSQGCIEASTLISGIESAVVKEGFGRYMAQCKHPDETADLIENAVKRGVECRPSMPLVQPSAPHKVRIEFNRAEEADMAVRTPGTERIDAYTIERKSHEWEDLHRSIWCMISLAEAGAQADK